MKSKARVATGSAPARKSNPTPSNLAEVAILVAQMAATQKQILADVNNVPSEKQRRIAFAFEGATPSAETLRKLARSAGCTPSVACKFIVADVLASVASDPTLRQSYVDSLRDLSEETQG